MFTESTEAGSTLPRHSYQEYCAGLFLATMANPPQFTASGLPTDLHLVLAPMEGVIDAVMRAQLTALGGYERCVTEFVRVSKTVLPPRVFHRYCPELEHGGHTPSGTPVYVQLLGSDPTLMAANAVRAAELGAPGIDLNFGCPAKTVNNSLGGAALLRTPDVMAAVCSAVREALPPDIPLTAKIRLGFDDDSLFDALVAATTGAGISELTVHARTRRQGYRPPAHWHQLARAVEQSPVPVIANGELWSITDVANCAKASGCNRFMLARGALCRPDLGRMVRAATSGDSYQSLSWSETAPLLAHFLAENRAHYDPRHAVNPVKQWLVYLKHYFPQAATLFESVKRLNCPDAMAQALDQHYQTLGVNLVDAA